MRCGGPRSVSMSEWPLPMPARWCPISTSGLPNQRRTRSCSIAWRCLPFGVGRPLRPATPTDGLWLDLAGCDHLYGGEERFCRRLRAFCQRAGFTARIAVADTPGAAHALARYGREDLMIVPVGGYDTSDIATTDRRLAAERHGPQRGQAVRLRNHRRPFASRARPRSRGGWACPPSPGSIRRSAAWRSQ